MGKKDIREGITRVRNVVIYDSKLRPIDKVVYLALLSRDFVGTDGRRKGKVWPSEKLLGEDLGVATRTLRRALRRLEDGGYITTQQYHGPTRGTWGSNEYELHVLAPALPRRKDGPQDDYRLPDDESTGGQSCPTVVE